MPNLLRLLLLASTILSLFTARWAYVQGQARQVRPVAVRLVLAANANTNLGPQWLPCASWRSWPVPAAYRSQRLVAGTATVSAF